ncbi:hypothetical protein K4W91_09405 [Pseudomonas aeruginosa]|uniref:hypothetical protein n=1 Tax=Pseudomonas aeruginosa TaxID=287 RepID=UPI000FD4C5BE|nr:hypothetical protein [Pseudomonas aeruginosa]MCD2821947.1 hypothetical protein [Pseudomonas aeruginosa]MCD2828286.1 hypothetical protein [Pseudomonas aeruginosa]RUI06078.1 hypothetical protein IPC449_15430 [Pseudomonas aeruginosa]HCF4143544.1 hypothetical protein [Pseudomonas aeruginosa]
MSDVRNITSLDNRFGCTYSAYLFNQESANKTFPIVPDTAKADPGEDIPTQDMWTPWCDSQKDLDEGHYIKATFSERGKPDVVNYIFQSGDFIYYTDGSKQFSRKQVMDGDSKEGKGEYKLEIHSSGGLPRMVLNKY